VALVALVALVVLGAVILAVVVVAIIMSNDSAAPISGTGDMRAAEMEAKARSIGAQPGETNHF